MAVEGITAGGFIQEVLSPGMRPESIILSSTNLLKNLGGEMFTRIGPEKTETMVFCRRRFGLAALAFGTVAILTPTPGPAESIMERAEGVLERLKDDIKGELQDLREDVREEVAYLYGMESYVYGYPLVMMDVTRQVLTAAPAPNSEGTRADQPTGQDATLSAPISRMSYGSALTRFGQRVGSTSARNRSFFRCLIPGTATM